MPNFHTLKRYSHRNAPKKLIPAIIACKCVTYLTILGLVICFCGLIPLFINPINEEYKEFNESNSENVTTISIETNDTIPILKEHWFDTKNANYIFYSCLGIGSLFLFSGIVCLIIAYYYFQTYQEERIRHIQITDLDADQTQPVITDPIIDGVGYPISLINKSKQSEYLPISQSNNIVYNSTTEPIK